MLITITITNNNNNNNNNNIGKPQPLRSVPFFWTAQYTKSLRYAGHAFHYDTVVIDGDLAAMKFLAVLAKDDVVAAVTRFARVCDVVSWANNSLFNT
jgi:hypothetical protein